MSLGYWFFSFLLNIINFSEFLCLKNWRIIRALDSLIQQNISILSSLILTPIFFIILHAVGSSLLWYGSWVWYLCVNNHKFLTVTHYTANPFKDLFLLNGYLRDICKRSILTQGILLFSWKSCIIVLNYLTALI